MFSKQCVALKQIKTEVLDPALNLMNAPEESKQHLIHQQDEKSPSWVESADTKTIKQELRRELSQALLSDKKTRKRFDFQNEHI